MLPLEAIETDAFRRRHQGSTFWCGLLLGGCGKQLSTKLYLDRVCHFAHYPEAGGVGHVCGRVATGIASADHLYLKRQLGAWLGELGLRSDGRLVSLRQHTAGEAPDYGVEVVVPAVRTSLQVRLGRLSDSERQRLAGGAADGVEWLFGEQAAADAEQVRSQRGFVHRVRCQTVGTDRVVEIGLQAVADRVQWFGLQECRLTGDGLLTPATAAAHQTQSSVVVPGSDSPSVAPVFPLNSSAVFFRISASPAGGIPAQAVPGNRAVVRVVLELEDGTSAAAWLSLPRGHVLPSGTGEHQLFGHAYLTPLALEADRPAWLVTADSFVKGPAGRAARGTERFLQRLSRARSDEDASAVERLCAEGLKLWKLLAGQERERVRGAVVDARLWIRGRDTVTRPILKATVPVKGLPPTAGNAEPKTVTSLHSDSEDVVNPVEEPQPVFRGQRGSAARSRSLVARAEEQSPVGPVTPLAPPDASALIASLRAAMEARDEEGVEQLCGEAADFVEPGAVKALRVPLASARSWLRQSEARAAVDEVRRLLDLLAADGHRLTAADLDERVTEASRQATIAGSMLSAYQRERLLHWVERSERLTKEAGDQAEELHNETLTVPVPDQGTPAPPSRSAQQPARLSVTELERLAVAVRGVLQDTARDQSTTSWTMLRHRVGPSLPHLHPDDQGEVLVRVDGQTPVNEPLLSTLIAVGEKVMHPLYRHVAFSLDREVPTEERHLRELWTMDVLRLHQLWRHR
ncbi:hypothetical protein OG239_42560 (plasmid) [Streptomyces sp. NBC_00868]|uniref:hypothetical protein n=1 Tax=Streptomyces sp. NBC_00868 TaxID=2903683 RepID=UPI002F9125F5|nr:hypothetical protein OG239_42560 [Streptomyces sp. NBC_00868]